MKSKWCKRVGSLCVCLALLAALAGCGDGKVQSTVSQVVSRVQEDVGDAVSRAESALDSMVEDDDASGLQSDLGSGVNSDLDSALDSGLGDELDSGLNSGDGVSAVEGEESSARETKDR